MAFTVGDLIKEAAIMAGQADPRLPTLAPEEQAYGFSKLQSLTDELAADRLAIYREQRVGPFSVTSGQGDVTASSPITIGPGGTWDTPRPLWIDRAGIIYTAGGTPRPELPVRVFTTQEWARIVVKGITATLSRALFYDRIMTAAGLSNIYLYPVPSASFQMVLYVPVAVAQWAVDADSNPVYTTAISLPPGYRSMLVSNLAMKMSIGQAEISSDLRDEAVRTLGNVKSSNVVTMMDALSCDAATLNPGGQNAQTFDWIGGGFT